MRIVQVAGTNGKGSICSYLSSICTQAGYRCGLFTSPHLVYEEERVRIDGEMIPKAEWEKRKKLYRGDNLFLTYTQAAMDWFRTQGVEVAVMETGLGGRLDPVSALGAEILVFGRIGKDHMHILGDTVEKIAKEKCGAILPGQRVWSVPQPKEAEQILKEAAQAKGAKLSFVKEDTLIGRSLAGQDFLLLGEEYHIQALPDSQRQIAAAAILAAKDLGIKDPAVIRKGLQKTVIPGRTMYFPGRKLLIDGAHNEDAFDELGRTLKTYFPRESFVFICAAFRDKDISRLKHLTKDYPVITTQLSGERVCPANILAEELNGLAIPDPDEAFHYAMAQPGLKIVTGSFYLAGFAIKKYHL